jgi:hypothetical protein
MSADALDTLLTRMPEISAAVGMFSSESMQMEVLRALLGAFVGDSEATDNDGEPSDSGSEVGVESAPKKNSSVKQRGERAKRVVGKMKPTFSLDKNLDFMNGGTVSFNEFRESKKPSSVKEKCLVSVSWLTHLTKSPSAASVDQVYTCFKEAGWEVPNDLVNTLQQAGTEGWLDTRKRDDLKVVVQGENYIEHKMPSAAKKAAGK